MSPYRKAIALTVWTIGQRAYCFRNLVVAVVITSAASGICAVLSLTAEPLAGLLLLFPMLGLFSLYDIKLLNDWRCQLLALWRTRELDFAALNKAVAAMPTLPKGSVRSMLDTLPKAGDVQNEQKLPSATRQAVVICMATLDACKLDSALFKTAGSAIVATSLIVAALSGRGTFLIGCLIVALLPPLQMFTKQKRLKSSRKHLLSVQKQPDFDVGSYANLISSLGYDLMSPLDRRVPYMAVLINSWHRLPCLIW